MISRKIGSYEIQKQLGSGGNGHVYAARDAELDRMVAVKVLRAELASDPTYLDRFRAEATNLARLNHPNITTLYTLHREGHEQFMIMELVKGQTMEDLLLQAGQLSVVETLAVLSQMSAGLTYAHRTGIIHRDIKPSNVMVLDDGLLKIMDFGIARVRGSQRMTRQGHVIGTLAYLAPEQVRGAEGDERSDLYSLAIMLYEMLSGTPPFQSDSDYELARAQVEQAPPRLVNRLPNLPAGIEAALMRALAKNPEERFASVDEFAKALGAPGNTMDAADTLRDSLLARVKAGGSQTRQIPINATAFIGEDTTRLGGGDGQQQKQPFRLPMPALIGGGAAAVLAVSVAIWLALPGPTPPNPTPHLLADNGQSQNQTQRKQVQQAPQPQPKPKQVAEVDPPHTVPTPPPAPPPKPPVTPVVEPPHTMPAPYELPHDLVLPQTRKPDVEGTIAGVIDSNTIIVSGHFVNLFGIMDPATSVEQTQWVQNEMKRNILAVGTMVNCYVHDDGGSSGGETYDCYINDQDLAEIAIKNGIAAAKAGAPSRYFDEEQQARASRRGIWAQLRS